MKEAASDGVEYPWSWCLLVWRSPDDYDHDGEVAAEHAAQDAREKDVKDVEPDEHFEFFVLHEALRIIENDQHDDPTHK